MKNGGGLCIVPMEKRLSGEISYICYNRIETTSRGASMSHPVNYLISMKVTWFVDGCRTVTTRNGCEFYGW